MAVDIPVFVDIEGAFKDAAKRVKSAMSPLQDIINANPLFLRMRVDIEGSKVSLKSLFNDATTSTAKFSSALDQINLRINKIAGSGGFDLMGKGLKAKEIDLLNAAQALELKLKGVNGEASALGRVLTINMKRAEQELVKYTGQLNMLTQLQNRSRSASGGVLSSAMPYQKQIDAVNMKIQQTKTFLGAVGTELDRISVGASRASAAVGTMKTQAMLTADGFRAGHEAIQRWNAGLTTANSKLLMLIKSSLTFVGLHSAVRFIQNVRNVTAEFEMQRVALGGIIQDTERAESLFRQIKAAAIKSPFEIKDLVSYTKQLSAYRIETDKLFDVTMKLADISAGLGVDMSRLVLAYGQVRAASVLRGQELRQFTEAGIPLVSLLAEKFEELGRVGTTTADVFELISKRAVPFSMIEEIFNDMTEAGGIFYKMQEKQSETLKGQWMKLKDAASIMYDEIGRTEGVHKAMVGMMNISMKLFQNWKSAKGIIGAAVAAMVAYKLSVANAAVAANALTLREAASLSALELNTIGRSKLIAAIMGENAATKVQIYLGNKLVRVKAREYAANNLLSKSYFKLRAAMLSNPYAAAAAGIALLIAGLVKLIKATKAADLTLDQFEKDIEGFSSAKENINDVLELCDAYDELAVQSEKTEKELDKFKREGRELAKMFPEMVEGVDEHTDALILNTEAIRENQKALQKAHEDKLLEDIAEAEENIAKIRERNRILSERRNGGQVYNPQLGGYVKYSENELKKFGTEMLKNEEDIKHWTEQLISSQRALYGFSEAAGDAADTFNGSVWRKEISNINKENNNVLDLTDEQIASFSSLEDALENLAKKWKDARKETEQYSEALKGALLSPEGREEIEALKQKSETAAIVIEAIMAMYGAMGLLKTKGSGGRGEDLFVKTTRDRIKFIKDFSNGVQKLNNLLSENNAIIKERQIMEGRGINLGFTGEEGRLDVRAMTGSREEVLKAYDDEIEKIKKEIARRGGAGWSNLALQDIFAKTTNNKAISGLRDLLADIFKERTDYETDQAEKDIERAIKKMADEVKRSETVRNFYNDILSLTGDEELATQLSIGVYGDIGKDFSERMQKQLDDAFMNINWEGLSTEDQDSVLDAFIGQDFPKIMKYLDLFPEKWQTELKKMAEDNEKFNADFLKDLYKTYEKTKTFEERRTLVTQREQNKRNEILANKNLTKEQKDEFIASSQQKEGREIAAIDVEELKATYEWTKAFEDLDRVGSTTLENLRQRIEQLINLQRENLTPEQLKTLTKELEKIKNVQAERNPFYAIGSGAQRAMLITGALNAQKTGKGYDKAIKKIEKFNKTARQTDKIDFEHLEDSLMDANKTMEDGIKGLGDYMASWKSVIDTVTDAFDLDDIPVLGETLQGVSDSLNFVATILPVIITLNAILNTTLMANPFIAMAAAIVATIGAIVGLIKGLINAKVERLNKKIEEQTELLERLEYSYDRLNKAIEKTFGTDYISNYQQQMKILEAQAEAYRTQADLERQKGKKSDEKAVKEYEEKLRDVEDEIKDARSQISEFFTDMDVTSAANDFANAWIDAYKEFNSTTDAIGEKFQEMIQNMVVKSMAAKIVQNQLQPIFDYIDQLSADDAQFSPMDAALVAQKAQETLGTMNTGLSNLMTALEGVGLNMRTMGSGLTGIAKDIQGASEQSILGLAAGINTQNFYISQIHQNVLTITSILSGGTATPTVNVSAIAETDPMREHLSNININLAELLRKVNSVITTGNANTNTAYVAIK